jgi:23S rRNA pseudouridine1911/1915/1917 synthase
MSKLYLNKIITPNLDNLRLDQALAKLLPQFSRSRIQQWIKNGGVSVDQRKMVKSKEHVSLGQWVTLRIELEDSNEWQGEEIPLEILFEDESLFVINKPPGLVVHPGAGNPHSTLVNALLHYDSSLKKIPRAGLIHRLDKDTSGALLVARNLQAYHFLSAKMQQREIRRTYVAIVTGHPNPTGTIDLPIGRHPIQRTKMAVLSHGGKSARTHYKVMERFAIHAYLEVELETGRTHQIRVHMAYIKHPILGDPQYGSPLQNDAHLNEEIRNEIINFNRQALHAKKIIFLHPVTKEYISCEAPLPSDFQILLKKLQKYRRA